MHAVSHSYWSLFCLQRWPSLHHFASTAFHKQQDWGTSTAAATTPRCLAFSRAQESCRNSSPWKIHWCSKVFKTKLQTVKAAQITSIYKQTIRARLMIFLNSFCEMSPLPSLSLAWRSSTMDSSIYLAHSQSVRVWQLGDKTVSQKTPTTKHQKGVSKISPTKSEM